MNRLRAILRHLLVLLLVASLVPGLGELAESVEHLVHDGHLPHSAEHEIVAAAEGHGSADDIEHGCTPMQHSCGCHVSTPGVPASGLLVSTVHTLDLSAQPDLPVKVLRSRTWPPATPPPNA